jgi:hypothetical protein
MSELEALRAYFEAHMAMHAAIDAEKFGAAYVRGNQARDRLIQIERERLIRFEQLSKEEM